MAISHQSLISKTRLFTVAHIWKERLAAGEGWVHGKGTDGLSAYQLEEPKRHKVLKALHNTLAYGRSGQPLNVLERVGRSTSMSVIAIYRQLTAR